ncbi:DNA cross-link repair 1A protein [Mobula birostris]|uniref:DNA cross-link repair 1A protein n=1 Tax=Mobula birostris TaxID=1983395 RepID=UPI003B28C2CF
MSKEDDIWDYKSVRKLRRPENSGRVGSPPPGKLRKRSKAEQGRSGRGVPDGLRSRRGAKCPEPERESGTTDRLSSRPLSPSAASVHHPATPSPLSRPADPSTPLKQTESSNAPGGKCILTNTKPAHAGHCPICQMPFSLLMIETPRWHVAECLDTPGCTDNECPDGLLCNSTIPRHYKRYSHMLLAESRALSQNDGQSALCNGLEKDTLIVSPDCNKNHQSSQNGQFLQIKESPTSKTQNALLLLKSPVNKVTGNKFKLRRGTNETPLSKKVSKKRISALSTDNPIRELTCSESQLTTQVKPAINMDGLFNETAINDVIKDLKSFSEHNSTFALASNTNYDDDDDDISYSPLCSEDEIPNHKSQSFPRKQLFQDQSIKHCCKSENIMFSDFRSQELSCKSSAIKDTVIPGIDALSIGPDPALLIDCVSISTQNRKEGETKLPHPKLKLSAYDWIPLNNKDNEEVNNQSQSNLAGCATFIKLESEDSNFSSLLLLPQIKEEQQSTLCAGMEELFDNQVRNEWEGNSKNIMETSLAGTQSFISEKLGSNIQKDNNPKNQILEVVSLNSLEKGSLNTPKRTAFNKELKQTDIGVFFGLQPKIKDEKECLKNEIQGKTKELFSALSCITKRQRQRKRKIDSSVGDEACVGNVEKLQSDLIEEQQRKMKRQRREMSSYSKNKQCPFYKKIPGTNFTVDAFQYGVIEGCTGYFLTHFHSDHYGGLNKNFRCPIYCSTITRNLVISKLKVQDQYVISLPVNTECIVEGVKVVLLDANHCPGAVMLLFQLPNGNTLLHTGDFRANASMERYSHLKGRKVHILYLDTTYCSPEYTFPSQQETIQFVGNIAFESVTMNPRTLVVCGTYSIGKEKVFLAIAEVLGCKVCTTKNKLDILRCLGWEQINSVITLDWGSSQLHLLPMMQITFKGLQAHMNKFPGKYDRVVAFKPTGWTYSSQSGTGLDIKPRVQGKIAIYGVPYSEHSSYLEMKRFVQWLKPNKIIPTVNNGSWAERKMMDKIFKEWMTEPVQ